MAAFYIHIPYCRQACHYCNFHFSTSLKTKEALLAAMQREIIGRKDYLAGEKISTIYFGGGTPSLLEKSEILEILSAVRAHYVFENEEIEITLEANPDDLSSEKLQELRSAGINRLSIGVQSFDEAELQQLHRVHNAAQSIACIEQAQKSGFNNISIDLIYGIPGQNDEGWMKNLEMLQRFQIPHFSAYALTVEPGTALEKMIRTGKNPAPDDEQAVRHFNMLQAWATENGFLPYEISNYGKPGHFSKHNTSYWSGAKYIGIGPSAHSFNWDTRQWNIANNNLYIKNIREGLPFYEIETLSPAQRYNEYVMTSLRTMWGLDMAAVSLKFGVTFMNYLQKSSAGYLSQGLMFTKDNHLYLTMAGKLLSDKIISDLFVVDDD